MRAHIQISVSPSSVTGTVTLNARIDPDGRAAGSTDVNIPGGSSTYSAQLPVNTTVLKQLPNGSKTLYVQAVLKDNAGNQLATADASAAFLLLDGPTIQISAVSVNGNNVARGSSVSIDKTSADVSVTVKRTDNSSKPGRATITLSCDGKTAQQSVDLASGGASQTVTLSISGLQYGKSYNCNISAQLVSTAPAPYDNCPHQDQFTFTLGVTQVTMQLTIQRIEVSKQ